MDLRNAYVEIVRRTGITVAVLTYCTLERGALKVTASGRVLETFLATVNTNSQTFTREYEILRADLARVCTDLVEARGVHFVYGDHVSSVSQDGTGSKIRGVYDHQAALGRARPRGRR
jgi:hypothetical protein